MSEGLKDCPFCNSSVDTVQSAMGEFWVMCPRCTASAGMYFSQTKAVEAWNSRAMLPEGSKE